MTIYHILLALLVVIIWGINFIFIKIGLNEIPPFLLCAVRFFLSSVPAIFFIKPPAIPFQRVALYGLIMFALQFSLLFIGMRMGMPPGLASLVIQVQVFFSMVFAAILLGEIPYIWQIIGALVSFAGIGLAATHCDHNVTFFGFVFILAAAGTWGLGNLIAKKFHRINMIALVVWSNFVACFPMLLLSLLIEGPKSIIYSYQHLTGAGIAAIFYIVIASTWIGYGVWNWLLSRYPVGMIIPFTLLVPIVGIASSVLILGEPLQSWKILAGVLVMSGLCINLLGTYFFYGKSSPSPSE